MADKIGYGVTQIQEVTISKVVTFFWCQSGARIWVKMGIFD